FGGKEDVTVEVYLGLLALRTGRPVKMVWTRQESLQARAKRHPYRMRYRTGALATGEIVAQQISLLADAGAYAYLSALVLLYSTVTAAGPASASRLIDRKSTRLNSSHGSISYAVFCLKKKIDT